jgi:DNA-binding NtrC family response regulator
VVIVGSSQDAFDQLQERTFALVISDLKMPHIDGMTLLRWVADNQPMVRRILLTGHADLNTALAAVNDAGVTRIIQKPWNDAELRVIVEAAIDEWEADVDRQAAYEASRA